VKTTFDLDEDLYAAVKVEAARIGRGVRVSAESWYATMDGRPKSTNAPAEG
jgi:hypothetical protein